MREHARINRIVDKLARYWQAHQDLRLTQVIGNFAGHDERGEPRDPYHREDYEFEKWLDEQLGEGL